MAVQNQDDQHKHTLSNYVRIWDVVQKTCLRLRTIGKSGERGSGISVLPARHDDDDDRFDMYINFRGLFNVKAILVEEPLWYHLNHSWKRDKGVHAFPKGICMKVNVIVWLKSEITYHDVWVQHISHYAMRTLPTTGLGEGKLWIQSRCTLL